MAKVKASGNKNTAPPGMIWDVYKKMWVNPTGVESRVSKDGNASARVPINEASPDEIAGYNSKGYNIPATDAISPYRSNPATPANTQIDADWVNRLGLIDATNSVSRDAIVDDIESRNNRGVPKDLDPLPTKQLPYDGKDNKLAPLLPSDSPEKLRDYYGTDLFGDSQALIDKNRGENADAYKQEVDEANKLYQRQRLRNLGILGVNSLGTMMQDTRESPTYTSDRFVNDMFPKITEADIQGQTAPYRSRVAGILEAITDSGGRGSMMSSLIAPIQSNMLEAEGRVRNNAVMANKNMDAQKYAKLNAIENANNAADVKAENAMRDNRNKVLNSLTSGVSGYIKSEAALDNKNQTQLSALLKARTANDQQLNNDELGLKTRITDRKIKKEWDDYIRKSLNDSWIKYKSGITE